MPPPALPSRTMWITWYPVGAVVEEIFVSYRQMIAMVPASTDTATSTVYYIFWPVILLKLYRTKDYRTKDIS